VWIFALAAMGLAACAPSTGATTQPASVTPVVNEVPASGPFQSPSGNIRCTMATYSAGGHTVRCEVSDHDWVAAQPDGCQMNWGDRVGMEEGSAAVFGCYGQDMPAPTHTLEYGQLQTLGPISCDSESVGITCTDNSTGHFFFVSRQTVNLG